MSIKLYYGTTETVAKSAPITGIKAKEVVLTNCYAAYQAFNSCDLNDRWAIIEINVSKLNEKSLVSYTKGKLWEKSIDSVGYCKYLQDIPSNAIGKVWVFNPKSNWLISRAVLHSNSDYYSIQKKSFTVINRWLTGEFMMIDEWLGEQKEEFTKEQKAYLGNLWNERSGLDLFYCAKV